MYHILKFSNPNVFERIPYMAFQYGTIPYLALKDEQCPI
jgi:hypothetical protein